MAKINKGGLKVKLTFERDGEVIEHTLDMVHASVDCITEQVSDDNTIIDHYTISGEVYRKAEPEKSAT